MKYKYYSIIILLLFFSTFGFGQPLNSQIKGVVNPSPEAASLGKFEEIPVDYSRGLPNISVPIHTVSDGNIQLPITLRYHASGIRVQEVSSWVGAGWDLSAGGMISRVVQGLADDQGAGFYRKQEMLVSTDVNQRKRILQGDLDSEPDIYSFSFPGYSGKFYFDENKQHHFVPKNNLKLELIDSGSPFDGFIITDPNGTKYKFGCRSATDKGYVEETIANVEETDGYRSGWYLVQIESHDGKNVIDLHYESHAYSYEQKSSCSISYFPTIAFCHGAEVVNSCLSPGDFIVDLEGMKIKSIVSNTDSVLFTSNTHRADLDNGQLLDEIKIKSGTFCKSYAFNYDYFEDPNSNGTASYRLKLDELQERSCDLSTTIPPYKFSYYGAVNDGVPFFINRNSKQIDHWGYYNGQTFNDNNTSSNINIPVTTVGEYTHGGANRNSDTTPNATFMSTGTLKSVQYPTGGKTTFEYEANTYKGIAQASTVRIFEIPKTCTDYNNECCNELSRDSAFTFSNSDELTGGQFELYMSPSEDCVNQDENYFLVRIEVYDDTGFLGQYECAIDDPSETVNIKKPFDDLYDGFQEGVEYTFILYTENAFGRFRLFSTPEFTDDIKVGGLRVKKVIQHDDKTFNDIVKEYRYTKSEVDDFSSGFLIRQPRYGFSAAGSRIAASAEGDYFITVFSEQSLVPLSTFEGYHIAYERVEEILPDNGKSTHIYDITFSGVDATYPSIPTYHNSNAGQLLQSVTNNEQNETKSITNVTPMDNSYTYSTSYFYKAMLWKELEPCPPDGTAGDVSDFVVGALIEYDFRTGIYLVKEKETILDGVSNKVVYKYDNQNRHYFPTEVITENSDEKIYTNYNEFIFDFSGVVYDAMEKRNIISTPIKSKVFVEGDTISGTYQICGFFTSNGLPGGGEDDVIYPKEFYNYEMTWDANETPVITGEDNGWDLQGTVLEYDMVVGKPKRYKSHGWEEESYKWNIINKQIQERQYEDFTWQYNYYPNTNLVSSITDIDAQIDSFEYDQLMRLDKVLDRDGKVTSNFTYHYNDGLAGDHNYVKTRTDFSSAANSELNWTESWQYLDGLGRPLQTVQRQHSTDEKDVISGAVRYDNQGRPVSQYEPYASNNNTGVFTPIPSGQDSTFTEYYASPLNRIHKVTPPDWYATTYEYGKNNSEITIEGTTYGIGDLMVNTIKDPNNVETLAFTDKRGRSILKKTRKGSEETNTYTIYDNKDRVRAILPPGVTDMQSNLAYRYLYDGADNVIAKEIPDMDKMEYTYDVRNLNIGMQDGNLRGDGKWMVTEYDNYGRPIITGLNTTPTVVDEIWTKTFWDGQAASNFAGFTNLVPPKDLPRDIQSLLDVENANLTPTDNSANPIYKGKVHYTETAILGGNTASTNRLLSINRYDTYGRVDRIQSDNHLGGFDNTFLYFDFADNLTKEIRFHSQNDNISDFVTQTRNYYDQEGRKSRNNHLISGIGVYSSELCSLDYDVKDQLITKKLGGTNSGGYLQEINYDYLPNRFLNSINPSMSANDLFQLNLNYDQEIIGLSGTGQKNGNITSLSWNTQGGTSKSYGYTYDYLDRLTIANYDSPDNDYGTTYNYDVRGNMTNLTRQGVYSDGSNFNAQQIDNMVFTPYAGTNKIKTITDAAPCPDSKVVHQALDNTQMHAAGVTIIADNPVNENASIIYQAGTSITLEPGFHAKAGTDFVAKIDDCPQGNYETDGFVQRSTNDYLYDNNGNQTNDPNKGIFTHYNYLNLPHQVTFNNGNVIEWLYLANGAKVQKAVTKAGDFMPMLRQDYIGGFEYQNDTIDAIYVEDGKMTFNSGQFKEYQYYLTDHLGNNRVVFKDDGAGQAEVVQENHYYPFGMAMKGDFARNEGKENKYLYNGKELDTDFGLNWYHYGARMYDPAIARWNAVDALAEAMASWSPYNYTFNNPIRFIDPDGNAPQDPPNGQVSWVWSEARKVNGKSFVVKRYQNVSAKTAKEYNQFNSQNNGLGSSISETSYNNYTKKDENGNLVSKHSIGTSVVDPNSGNGTSVFSSKQGAGDFDDEIPLSTNADAVNVTAAFDHDKLADNTTISVGDQTVSSGNVIDKGQISLDNANLSRGNRSIKLNVTPMNPNSNAPWNIDPSEDSIWSVDINYTTSNTRTVYSSSTANSTRTNSQSGEALGGTKKD